MESRNTGGDELINYIAIYLPNVGVTPAMETVSARNRDDLLNQARKACPREKRLSRIVRADDPSRNLWESSKGWLPTLEEQQRNSWR